MSGTYTDYAEHFQEGKRVRVGVPLADGGSFQEWGVVRSLESDLLELDLSRDFLPEQARIELGHTLDLGVLDRQQKLCSRGLVAGVGERRLVLRLVDGFSPFEPREFFRQDVFLPLDYRVPPRQQRREVQERWHQSRWSLEFAAQEPEPGEAPELEALREEIRTRLEKKKSAPPVAANISGGGVRFDISRRLRIGTFVELSVYLPQPRRVLEMVGEVVQVRQYPGQERFSTALRFRYIDEGDRDRLIGHICSEQLRQLSPQSAWQPQEGGRSEGKGRRRQLRLALALLILALLLGYEVRSIVASRERGEKHEIELLFEKGIAEILRRR